MPLEFGFNLNGIILFLFYSNANYDMVKNMNIELL